MNLENEARSAIGQTLSDALQDSARSVIDLERQIERISREEVSRRRRVADAIRQARRSPRDATRAPVRIWRALRRASPTDWQRSSSLVRSRPAVILRPTSGEDAAVAQRRATVAAALGERRQLVVAALVSERTGLGLQSECELVDLHQMTTEQALQDSRPDLLLIESPETWGGDAADCRAAIGLARERGIPTALWTSVPAADVVLARLVDHVFTTELASVSWLVMQVGHRRVHACPPATGPMASAATVASTRAEAGAAVVRVAEGEALRWGTGAPPEVLDLLAAGVPTICTFMRGTQVVLGDLVPMASAGELDSLARDVRADIELTARRTAAARRRVLTEHTFGSRLETIAWTVAGLLAPDPRVGVVAAVAGPAEAEAVAETVSGLCGIQSTLLLVSDEPAVAGLVDARVISPTQAQSTSVQDAFADVAAVMVLDPANAYGAAYAEGLLATLRFAGAGVATKATRFRWNGAEMHVTDPGHEYEARSGRSAVWSRSLAAAGTCFSLSVAEVVAPGALVPDGSDVATGDRYDFCEGLGGLGLPDELSTDRVGTPGATLREIETQVRSEVESVLGPELAHGEVAIQSYPTGSFHREGVGSAVLSRRGGALHVAFAGRPGAAWHIPFGGSLPVEQVLQGSGRLALSFDADTMGFGRVGVRIRWQDKDGRKLAAKACKVARTTHRLAVPEGAERLVIDLRLRGTGVALFRSIALGPESELGAEAAMPEVSPWGGLLEAVDVGVERGEIAVIASQADGSFGGVNGACLPLVPGTALEALVLARPSHLVIDRLAFSEGPWTGAETPGGTDLARQVARVAAAARDLGTCVLFLDAPWPTDVNTSLIRDAADQIISAEAAADPGGGTDDALDRAVRDLVRERFTGGGR